MSDEKKSRHALLEPVAGNGLLDRRLFLRRAAAVLGGAALTPTVVRPAAAEPLRIPDWTLSPGTPMRPYGSRSPQEAHVERTVYAPATNAPGSGASMTPLEHLEGTVTPNSLHFERHHNGFPEIDPQRHRVVLHGLVERPLSFDMEALLRYPRVSRIHFLECSGNSAANNAPEPPPLTAGQLHGLISGGEWTGVPVRVLLDEAGVKAEGKWVVAEGADSAAMNRSIPLAKLREDGMLALFQNGERLRPENGYPVRLFLPGWEGNTSIKWLRRLEVTDRPVMSREETAKYSDLRRDGTAELFTFAMDVKSVITSPSGGLKMHGPGYYEVSGLAWSGHGRIRKVEVSADGGRTWAEAALSEPVLPRALTRFRVPWRWDGKRAVLQSRAVDEAGHTQPTREAFMAERGPQQFYHYNAIQSWEITPDGEVRNVYA